MGARHSSVSSHPQLKAPGLALAVLVLIAAGCSRSPQQAASAAPTAAQHVRAPVVAGQFYPGDPTQLTQTVDGYLGGAKAPANARPVVALVSPHAGYDYCGKLMGQAYRSVKGGTFSTVVIVGPSHRAGFAGAALCSAEAWETPLGTVAADTEVVKALAGRPGFGMADEAHAPEHCIEVQLPFLERAIGDFRLVAILMSDFSRENCARVAKALAETLQGRSALLVASSDMSHYPAYDDARKTDRAMLDAIRTFDPDKVRAEDGELMRRGTPGLACTLCGLGPVITVMDAAKQLGADGVEVLGYANSGDAVPQMKDRVVGYCAVAMYGGTAAAGAAKEGAKMSEKPAEKTAKVEEGELNKEQQRKLLGIARRAIEEYVRAGKVIQVTEDDPALTRLGGVFVTLREGEMLRGCIGDLEGREPLYLNVRDKAIASATQDPRFEPVRAGEIKGLHLEISVLSPMRRVSDPSEIVVGKHGVLVSQGSRGGVYLPQVATEQGWNREQMLTHLCQYKAGLAPDAWKRGAELYCFTAQVFGEEEHGH